MQSKWDEMFGEEKKESGKEEEPQIQKPRKKAAPKKEVGGEVKVRKPRKKKEITATKSKEEKPVLKVTRKKTKKTN
jgi:hypothetical protein